MKIYGIIYLIINKVNNKCYVGQTTNEKGFNGRYNRGGVGIEKVYNFHKTNKNRNKSFNLHLLSAIEKYGFEAFEVKECIDVAFSREELNIKEKVYIQLYNSFKNGYNNTLGGEGRTGMVVSEETKRKLSIAFSGENNPMYGMGGELSPCWGRHLSEETKQKISEAIKGENNPMYGKTGEQHPNYGLKHTEESKKKISKSLKGKYVGEKAYWYGKERDEETKQKISETHKGKTLSEEHRNNISKSLKGKYTGERNPNYGKKVSEETREKLSRINKLKWEDEEYRQMMVKKQSGENNYWYGKQLSEEHKKKLSEAKKGKYKRSDSPHAKAVYCYELDEIRLCAKEWADELKLSNAHISSCCTGKRKSTGGYHFRYATGEEIEEYKKNKGLI